MDGCVLLRCREEQGALTVVQVCAGAENVILPEELSGLPVRRLGPRAFAPRPDTGEGEAILLGAGAPDSADNRRIRMVTLPDSLCAVGDYAFYNCTGLTTLSLCGTAEDWGGCALMNCIALSTFHIRMGEHSSTLLSYFADELPWELDMTLSYADGQTARLLFPAYQESYEENSPAHHFDYFIHGAGYPYHHCFREKHFSFARYDSLWPGFLQAEHETDSAVRLAFFRLRHPAELSEEARQAYLDFLRAHCGETLSYLLTVRDVRGLSWALPQLLPDRASLTAACAQARASGLTEALALLMEDQHRRFSTGACQDFSL